MNKKLLLIAALFAGAVPLFGKVVLPGIFSDHAVLTRSSKTAVFGKADPGEKVTVSLDKAKVSAVADENGNWKAFLDLSNVGTGPFELKINDKIIKDVLVGNVWLCSGQSNMAFRMANTELFAKLRPESANNFIRQFKMRSVSSADEKFRTDGEWSIAGPSTLGDFTGVGYYFARKLNAELNIPIGLINSSWGGSPVEAWIPGEEIKNFPEVVKRDAETAAAAKVYPEKVEKYLLDREKWIVKNNRLVPITIPGKDTKWKSVKQTLFPEGGVLWLRNYIEVSPKDAGKTISVYLQRQNTPFTFFVNGVKIYDHPMESVVRNKYVRFNIPGKLLKAGKNEILFRYYSPNRGRIRFVQPVRIGKNVFDDLPWDMFQEITFKGLKGYPRHPGRPPRDFFNGGRLFNGMIYPVLPYTITGTIWYQGETNAPRANEYAALQKCLIESWRKQFKNPEMPFYVCSLANFKAKSGDANAEKEDYADLRDAQIKGLTKNNSGIAILTDVGEASDIHPIDKRTPGERLAAIALANVYGKKVPFAGPKALEAKRDGKAVKISFANGKLCAGMIPAKYPLKKRTGAYALLKRNSPEAVLEGFALCGKDGKWFWADKADIAGNSVKVSSKAVPEPVKVRYNWSNNPDGNLYNKDGFPAEPFALDVK